MTDVSLLDRLSDPETWERFCEYKMNLACPKQAAKELRAFMDARGYLAVCDGIARGDRFPLPRRAVISKQSSGKKRVVYVYPPAENTVLKLLTFLLLRECDGLFSPGLWSFRPGRTAKDAVRSLLAVPNIGEMWAYKVDIHDYFNSVPVERLLPRLAAAVGSDRRLFSFLSALLTEPEVLENGRPLTERKGIMAGTPLSAFYANLYLAELDREFWEKGVPYARYSDDILLFAPDRETLDALAARLRERLAREGLALNPQKEELTAPGEGWTYLGFRCQGRTVDIAPATVEKLRQKMRRKTRALARWADRYEAEPERAARAFLRVFHRKLLESPEGNDLSWSRWFFPVITTAESLHKIDVYAQDCLRYLLTGKRNKGRYAAKYQDLKALGYRNLVHEYYEFRQNSQKGEKPL